MSGNDVFSMTGGQELKRDLRIALLAICLVGVLAVEAVIQVYRIGGTVEAYRDTITESVQERSELRRAQLLLARAEIFLDAHATTGDRSFLADFDGVRTAAEAILRSAPADAADAGRRARSREAVASVLDHLATLAARRNAFGDVLPDGAAVPAPTGPDAALTARTASEIATAPASQRLLDALVSLEDEDIRIASQEMNAQIGRTQWVSIVLMSSILVLVAGAALVVLAYVFHRTRIEQQLVDARIEAEAANRAKSEFLATMSHEIRTPLTSIVGYAELLLEGRLSTAQRHSLERLQSSGTVLRDLVNDVLDFSKIEAGEVKIEREAVSLGALLADVLSIVSSETERKGIDLVRDVDPMLPDRVFTDGTRLRQVLLNLLNNAVKFTDRGSVMLRVVPVQGDAANLIRFEVRDTGIGIARDKHHRVFQKFSQVDSSIGRQYGGTGLGLAISRSLVQLLGGEIGMDSDAGKGSVFWIELPLPPVHHAIETESEQDTAEAASVEGGRILLVEDSLQNQELVSAILEMAGHEVDLASDGFEALRAVETHRYDVVLMDMQMPRMNGVEATRRIRSMQGPARDVPIIAMTANVLREHLDMFRRSGADDYVAKPFRKAALLGTVNRWMTIGKCGVKRSPAGLEPGEHDAAVLADARELMGEAWVRACLARLSGNLDIIIGTGAAGGEKPAELRRRAHQIVADAGQLGFAMLSDVCAELEQACARGHAGGDVHDRARVAARRTIAYIADLLETPGQTASRPAGDAAAQQAGQQGAARPERRRPLRAAGPRPLTSAA